MKKIKVLIIIAFAFNPGVKAQLTLDSCKRLAHEHYPAIQRFKLIEHSREFNISNAAKGWLPQINVTATSAWFTDIINLPQQADVMIGGIGHSLYNVGLQISQSVYDGGEVSARKHEAEANAAVSRESNNIIMYEVNSRVEQIYFGVLTLDEKIRQNRLLQDDLAVGMRTVTALEHNGMANRGDIEAVSVEQLKSRQQEEQLKASRRAYMLMLSAFIGRTLNESSKLEMPENPMCIDGFIGRSELDYYSAKDNLLDIRRQSLNVRLKPHVSVFALGMYHNKPTTIMKNGMLAAGLTLNWNIGALYTRANDLKLIDNERGLNNVERETFLFNTSLKTRQSNGVIEALKKQILLDNEIIALRQSIVNKAEKKVANGTETVNEMLRDINAVSEARLMKALRELQLTQELYNLKNINNN